MGGSACPDGSQSLELLREMNQALQALREENQSLQVLRDEPAPAGGGELGLCIALREEHRLFQEENSAWENNKLKLQQQLEHRHGDRGHRPDGDAHRGAVRLHAGQKQGPQEAQQGLRLPSPGAQRHCWGTLTT